MSISKEVMGEKFDQMRDLLRPEAEIHQAYICMTELLMMFFDYIDERREDFENYLEDMKDGNA